MNMDMNMDMDMDMNIDMNMDMNMDMNTTELPHWFWDPGFGQVHWVSKKSKHPFLSLAAKTWVNMPEQSCQLGSGHLTSKRKYPQGTGGASGGNCAIHAPKAFPWMMDMTWRYMTWTMPCPTPRQTWYNFKFNYHDKHYPAWKTHQLLPWQHHDRPF